MTRHDDARLDPAGQAEMAGPQRPRPTDADMNERIVNDPVAQRAFQYGVMLERSTNRDIAAFSALAAACRTAEGVPCFCGCHITPITTDELASDWTPARGAAEGVAMFGRVSAQRKRARILSALTAIEKRAASLFFEGSAAARAVAGFVAGVRRAVEGGGS